MNRTELITAVAEKTDLTKKDSEKAVSAVIDTIIEAVAKGEKVQIIGFGTFERKIRKARMGVDPKTHEPMQIAEKKIPNFKPGKAFKDVVENIESEDSEK